MFDSTRHLEDSIPESRQTAAKEIKSPLRGFKWLSRRCAALNRASHGVGFMGVNGRDALRRVRRWKREGHNSLRPSRERRCCAYADLAKTDGTTTPGIPGYATIGLCQDAGGARLSRPGESGGCPRARRTRAAPGAWHCGKVVGRIGAWHSVCSVCREAASVYSVVKRRGGVRTSRAEAARVHRALGRVRTFPRQHLKPRSGDLIHHGTRSRATDGIWDLSLPSATRCPRARCTRAALGAWRCGVDGNNGWSRILAKTDCGVARYSGRRSHIGLCQNCVCEASAFPRRERTRRSASLPWAGCPANGRDKRVPPVEAYRGRNVGDRAQHDLKPRSGDLTT